MSLTDKDICSSTVGTKCSSSEVQSSLHSIENLSVTFIERFVHSFICLRSHEPMSLFLTVGRLD